MKRIAILVLIGLLAVAASGFTLMSTPDFGIGVSITTINFDRIGAMLNFHIPKVPLMNAIGFNWVGDPGAFELAVWSDYWLLHRPLGKGYFSWYLGLGGTLIVEFDPTLFGLGIRLPIGLQIWPAKTERLEVFVEMAPAWVPLWESEFVPTNFKLQGALGVRLWFERGTEKGERAGKRQ
jgi:hypothetical protein